MAEADPVRITLVVEYNDTRFRSERNVSKGILEAVGEPLEFIRLELDVAVNRMMSMLRGVANAEGASHNE